MSEERNIQGNNKICTMQGLGFFACKFTRIWSRNQEEYHGMLADAKPSEITRDTERIFWICGPIFSKHGLAVALFVVMANTTDVR